MNRENKIKKLLQKFENNNSKGYRIISDFILKNGVVADIAIFKDEECIAYGKYYEKLYMPNNEERDFYFFGKGIYKNQFLMCGTIAKYWFYFDDVNIYVNDIIHFKVSPNELMKDFADFFNRISMTDDQFYNDIFN